MSVFSRHGDLLGRASLLSGSLARRLCGGRVAGSPRRVACTGGRSALRRCQRLDRLRRTRNAIAPTAAEARAPLARRRSPATAPHVGATCAPLVRTKSGPVRVGTSAPYRRPRLRSPAVPPGRWRDGHVGEGCGVATSDRLSTVSYLLGRLHRRLMRVRIERICCLDKRRVAQVAGGRWRDGFVGGGCGGWGGRSHCLVEGSLAALGALDALGHLVHGGVRRELEGVVGEEVGDGAEVELGVVALPDVGDGTAYCPIRPTNVYDRQNHL